MTESRRLPSFNDFSPGILGDIREPLRIVQKHQGKPAIIHKAFADAFFGGVANKRSTTNVPVTLKHTGLMDDDYNLTEFGRQVLGAKSKEEAAGVFCRRIILEENGNVLLEAVQNLHTRGFRGRWKLELKRELQRLGITNLKRATTDHTTLANWMVEAGILDRGSTATGYSLDDGGLKATIGITSAEYIELLELDEAQRRFLYDVRVQAESEGTKPVSASPIITSLLTRYPDLFREDQFRAEVAQPAKQGGWIETSGLTSGRGAKSGSVAASDKLLRVPIDLILEDFAVGIPPDLRSRLNTPRSEIDRLLKSGKKHERGLGFELLTLRMLLDLSLQPKGFRKRSRETAYAEIDLLAEGTHLVFSRWTVQCKCTPGTTVDLSDVAKEVGIALHQKAHVVMVVTSGRFTNDALSYADEVSRDQYFQFLMLDGKIVNKYLKSGKKPLLDYVIKNAEKVMQRKASQRRRELPVSGDGD